MISPLKPSDIDGFVEVARLSQLMDVASLNLHRDQFDSAYKAISAAEAKMTAFADHLVLIGALTEWQCDNLLNGKHRGFFHEKYVLQNRIRREFDSTIYSARHTETEKNVLLRIIPRSRLDSTAKEFTVELVEE
jgi:eukaryotic-like serine/threonine-protein kinase